MVLRPLKSILLKLNSSFKEINWRCLHKLFSKLWNNQTSGASCLSRCLIYKVHTVRFTFSVSRRALSLSLHPAFVKNFFQVFSNFFSSFIRCLALWPLRLRLFFPRRKALAYIIKSCGGCQYLFSIFFLFFSFCPVFPDLCISVHLLWTFFRRTPTCTETLLVLLW